MQPRSVLCSGGGCAPNTYIKLALKLIVQPVSYVGCLVESLSDSF